MKNDIIGIINVGASAFRMHISEFKGDEERILDFLVKPLRLGTDTFTQGYISLEKVMKATEILTAFRLKLKEYGITKYKAMCTSGVREATNREFFLDYTFRNSGIKLEVLDPADEIYIKYVSAANNVPDFRKLEEEGLVFANVSSGTVTLNITLKNNILYAGSLPYGSLRLRQMFQSISHLKRHKAIEEYVYTMISRVISTLDPSVKVRHLLGAGSSINLMSKLFNPHDNHINLSDLKSMYENIRTYSLSELQSELGLRKDEASVLLPTLITYMHLLDITGSKYFSYSSQSFPHIMALYYSGRMKDPRLNKRITSTLFYIAEKYNANTRHARWVYKFAVKLFNGLHSLHALDKSHRHILEAAVILNDVGRYMADQNLAGNSHYIIKSLTIPGIEPGIMRMAACVVYEVNRTKDNRDPQDYTTFTSAEKLVVQKLTAIMKVAKALDFAQQRHIYDIEIAITGQVIVYASAEIEPYLEVYAFDHLKQMFTEVFGISIDLRAKVNYE